MTRDYARRPAAKTQRKKRESHFGLWVFTIIIFISFTLGLVYLGKDRQHIHHGEATTEHNISINNKELSVMERQKPKLQFDFDTPKKAENKVVTTEQKAVVIKPVVEKDVKYVLYIAKVKDYAAVDRWKAQLALLGLEAKVTPIKVRNIYCYKISVGPYDKKSALEKQLLLKQHKIKAIINN